MNRLEQKYTETVKPSLMKEFGYTSSMEAPKLVKVVLNMGVGDAIANPKALEEAVEEMTQIAGQKPVIILDKLFNISLPRVRDFRGVSTTAFDGRGNYTLGVREQLIFPEINFDKVNKVRGLDVVIVTTAKTNKEAYALLEGLGMPFAK